MSIVIYFLNVIILYYYNIILASKTYNVPK